MAKKLKASVRLHIAAGSATPAPPVGPALAQHGMNIGEFCQKFNEMTRSLQGFKLPVDVLVYDDRSYEIKLHQPQASQLIKKAANVEKGSGNPSKTKVGKISRAQLRQIAEQKMQDLNTDDLDQAMKSIEGTAKSLGITVE